MKRIILTTMLVLLAPLALAAQSGDSTAVWVAGQRIDPGHDRDLAQALAEEGFLYPEQPFSRLAVQAGVSSLGFDLEVATGVTPHLNLRGVGDFFSESLTARKEDGLTVTPSLHLASARAGVDFYPFVYHGLRLSAGVNILNANKVEGTFTVPNGQSFVLDGTTYYASGTVNGSGTAPLHSSMPGLVLTTGWGNPVRTSGRALKFPFEAGVAIDGSPTVTMAMTSGMACTTSGGTCYAGSDPTIEAALLAQSAVYKHALKRLEFYPVISFGVSYSFSLRKHREL